MVDLDPTPSGREQTADPPEQRIDVTQDGPYHVFGSLPLRHVAIVETEWDEPVDVDQGEPLATGRWYALCSADPGH